MVTSETSNGLWSISPHKIIKWRSAIKFCDSKTDVDNISNKTDLMKRLLYPQECLKKVCKNTVAYIHPEGSTCFIAQITMRRLRRWAVIILNVACKGRNQQVFLMSYAGILQLPLMIASVRVWRVILWVVREPDRLAAEHGTVACVFHC